MISPQVKYNSEASRFEAECRNGLLDTYFVYPPKMKEGDILPNLYVLKVQDATKPFRISGIFDEKLDCLKFVLYGPKDYLYKMSVQLEASEDEPYIWKYKKHGETNGKGFCEKDIMHVPRSICLGSTNVIDSTSDVIRYWTFYDRNLHDQFFKLRNVGNFFFS